MSNTVEFILRLRDLMSSAMTKATSSTQRDMGSATNAVRNFQKRVGDTHSINTMERALRMLERRRRFSMDTSEITAANAKIKALQNRIRELKGASIAPIQVPSVGGGGESKGMTGSFVKGGLIVDLIKQTLGFVKDQLVDSYQVSLKNSSLNTAINATTGGQGRQAVEMTSSIADKYGLNYEASLEGVKTLTGGLKSMNMTLAQQMDIYEGVSTGIAAMKLSADESKGAMLALGQMASKGKVSAEELRGQLGERIPGAFGIAAKAMGVTEAKLGDMMQAGDLAAKDFLPRFAAEMRKTFGADALEAAKGPQAIQERFNNAIFKMKAGIGDGLMPMVTPVLEQFTILAQQVLPHIQAAFDWITDAVKGLSDSSGGWGEWIALIKGYFMAIWPTVKGIAGNIFGIVKSIIDWIGKSEILKDIFSLITWIMEKAWNVIGWIVDKISWVWENVLKPILDGLESAYRWVKDLVGADVTVSKSLNINSFMPAVAPAAAPGQPLVTTGLYKKPQQSAFSGSPSDLSSTDATHKGPKQIIVNINKEMIGKLQFVTQNGKEAAMDIENTVREALYRILYSLEGA